MTFNDPKQSQATANSSSEHTKLSAEEAVRRLQALEDAVKRRPTSPGCWIAIGALGIACAALFVVFLSFKAELANAERTIVAMRSTIDRLDRGEFAALSAQRIAVVGPDGREVVRMSRTEGGTGVVATTNSKGQTLVQLTATEDGGMVATTNGNGQELVRLGATKRGEGAVVTINRSGRELVQLTATEGGNGAVITINSKGQTLVQLAATEGGEGMVATTNGNGQELVRLGATEGGNGMVATINGKGQELVRLGATGGGEGVVATTNGKGQTLVQLATTRSGEGAVVVFDPSGRNRRSSLLPIP